MSTLAESFLADLEESSAEENEEGVEAIFNEKALAQEDEERDLSPQHDTHMKDTEEEEDVDMDKDSLFALTKLHRSSTLRSHLEAIARDDDGADYGLIMRSNELISSLNTELTAVFRFVSDIYSKKFPELERLVPHPAQYARVLQTIQNKANVESTELSGIVPAENIMIICMTASTTSHAPLDDEQLQSCLHGCKVLLQIDDALLKILSFVEGRMSLIAPNMSALCGSSIASRLMGIAGGLEALSKIPACNIRILGAQRSLDLTGFAKTVTRPHEGILAEAEVVTSAPSDLRGKALRLLADKIALAARVDAFQTGTRTDTLGRELRDKIERHLEKLQEPAKRKEKKALPAPIETSRKKRGGRRHRKMKERFELTELSKQKNRMVFGEAEQEYGGVEFGMIGASDSGRLRTVAKDTQKLAKLAARKQARKRSYGSSSSSAAGSGAGGGAVSGVASSLAFTPVQGLELVNPLAQQQRLREANDKYFRNSAGFLNLQQQQQQQQQPSKKQKSA